MFLYNQLPPRDNASQGRRQPVTNLIKTMKDTNTKLEKHKHLKDIAKKNKYLLRYNRIHYFYLHPPQSHKKSVYLSNKRKMNYKQLG